MNKLIASFVGTLTLTAAATAVAAPDWHLIEKARAAKQDQVPTGVLSTSGTGAAGARDCAAPQPLVLPLDHGPRAQTTPALNEKRRQAYEANATRLARGASEADCR